MTDKIIESVFRPLASLHGTNSLQYNDNITSVQHEDVAFRTQKN